MAADWVIVVDDDRNDQRLACEMLRRAGIRTSAMRSGAAALDYIRKGGMPDLILLDVNMPGTDGFETLRLLREQMEYDKNWGYFPRPEYDPKYYAPWVR